LGKVIIAVGSLFRTVPTSNPSSGVSRAIVILGNEDLMKWYGIGTFGTTIRSNGTAARAAF
jgi:hypothetical protein